MELLLPLVTRPRSSWRESSLAASSKKKGGDELRWAGPSSEGVTCFFGVRHSGVSVYLDTVYTIIYTEIYTSYMAVYIYNIHLCNIYICIYICIKTLPYTAAKSGCSKCHKCNNQWDVTLLLGDTTKGASFSLHSYVIYFFS